MLQPTSIIQQLFDQPYRFEFFQAVQLLERWLVQNGSAPEQALTSMLRFKNSVRLDFPASEIEALGTQPALPDQTVATLLNALQTNQLQSIELTPAFIGFLGSSGTLPAHYSERISSHLLFERDAGPRAFLDTFSNRAVAQFYQAWRKHRLESSYAIEPGERFLPLLQALAGLGFKGLQQRGQQDHANLLDESLGYYAAALRQRPASAAMIARVLADYFSVPVSAEQFIGHWCAVPTAQQTRLGTANAILGAQALIGERVWQRDLRLRLTFGPLERAAFEGLLPGASAALALEKMLTLFTGITLEYEIRLVLRRQAVQGLTLAAQAEGSQPRGRLGWDTFLLTGTEQRDRADVQYCVHSI